MIPNDLAKTSTAAMKLVLPNLIVPRKDFSTEAISITQAGTETREVTTINRNISLKFLVLIFIEEISNPRSLSLLHGLPYSYIK